MAQIGIQNCRSKIRIFTLSFILLSASSPTAVNAREMSGATQRIVSAKFSGGCTQNKNYPGQVVMEEKYDPTCRLKIVLSGSTERIVTLQYWDDEDEKWYEDSRKTTKKRTATINIKARNCGDNADEYCDGEYEFRILVLASKKPKISQTKSSSFTITYVALGTSDCDPDYESC